MGIRTVAFPIISATACHMVYNVETRSTRRHSSPRSSRVQCRFMNDQNIPLQPTLTPIVDTSASVSPKGTFKHNALEFKSAESFNPPGTRIRPSLSELAMALRLVHTLDFLRDSHRKMMALHIAYGVGEKKNTGRAWSASFQNRNKRRY